MITHYFEFVKVVSSCARDQASRAAAMFGQEKRISSSASARVRIVQFPEVSLQHRSFSVLNSMVNDGAGCLVFLEGLTVLEISKKINFKSKVEFRQECKCEGISKRVRNYCLRDFLKLSCDITTKKISYDPECRTCGKALSEDSSETVFSSYKIVRVLMENSFQPEIDLYVEEEHLKETLGNDLREGDRLEGIYFLDGVVKLKRQRERFIGNQVLSLLAVNPRRCNNSKPKGREGAQMAPDPLKLANKKLKFIFTSEGKFGFANLKLTEDMAENLRRSLYFANLTVWQRQPQISLIGYIATFVHLLNQGKRLSPSNSSGLKEQNTSNMVSNIIGIVLTTDTSPTLSLVENIASRYLKVEVAPHFPDVESLSFWLISNKDSFIIFTNIEGYSLAMKGVIFEAVEKRRVRFNNKPIPINPTIIFFINPSLCRVKITAKKTDQTDSSSLSEFLPVSFLDSLDFCVSASLGLDTTDRLDDTSTINQLGDIFEGSYFDSAKDRLNELHCPQGEDVTSNKENCGISQNTRISNLCKQITINFSESNANGATSNSSSKELWKEANFDSFANDNYPAATRLLEEYLSQSKYLKRFSSKHVESLKKLALGIRVFRLLSFGFFKSLEMMMDSLSSNCMQIEIIDAILSIAILESSVIHLYGPKMGLFGDLPALLLNELTLSSISETELSEIEVFYKKCCPLQDFSRLLSSFHEELTTFCCVA